MTTLKITKELFFRMVTDFPTMGVEVMRVLAHRLELTTVQLREAKSRGRLERFHTRITAARRS